MENSQINTPEGREWLTTLLREQQVIVTFNKKDGDQRIMTCTLNQDLIPENKKPKTKPEDDNKKKNENVLAVYDINAEGWRSFTWANVTNIEFSLDNEDLAEQEGKLVYSGALLK
jgi:hypothetical protein